MKISRRQVVRAGLAAPLGLWFAACGDGADETPVAASPTSQTGTDKWRMPAEEDLHEATWMCFPGRADVWGEDLRDVQATIAEIGLVIAAFEPVRMLTRPVDMTIARDLVGTDLDLIEAPVDDLWARDTLSSFVVSDDGELAAASVRFNGWGDKQIHDGDAMLAGLVAEELGVTLIDSGLVGEGGGLEVDGGGTVLAARSSWVNDNRNPGLGEDEISARLVDLLGAERLLWIDGVAGEDITDGHIDTLARFGNARTIVHELTSYVEPGETWYDVAVATAEQLGEFRTLDGDPYDFVTLRQPETTRRSGPEFLASYVNYYVCNGAVVISEFGDDRADRAAADQIGVLYPDREVVAINVDPVAAGGGGIHCATQQQPAT